MPSGSVGAAGLGIDYDHFHALNNLHALVVLRHDAR